jgi:hypothetical protein
MRTGRVQHGADIGASSSLHGAGISKSPALPCFGASKGKEDGGWRLASWVHNMFAAVPVPWRRRLLGVLLAVAVVLVTRDMVEHAMLGAVQYSWCPEPQRTWLRLSAAAVVRRARHHPPKVFPLEPSCLERQLAPNSLRCLPDQRTTSSKHSSPLCDLPNGRFTHPTD